MNARNKILFKQAQMLALHNKYMKAMRASQAEIEKIAAAEMRKQAMYRKVLAGLKGLGKQADEIDDLAKEHGTWGRRESFGDMWRRASEAKKRPAPAPRPQPKPQPKPAPKPQPKPAPKPRMGF